MRRRGHARRAPVAAGQNLRHFRQRNFSLPDLHQGAHDAPAHFVKKTVALNDEGDLRTGFLEVAARKPADVGFHFVTARAGKRFEIMPADKQFRRRPHFRQLQFRGKMPRAMPQQRIHDRLVPDEIAILLARRVKAGMKFFRRARRRQHADVGGQKGVEREREPADRHLEFRARNLDVRHHAERVDARVRAAGTVDAFDARKHFAERRLDFLLHARAGLLHLPALISRAVVGDDEFEFHKVLSADGRR